jgi:hypothetical protein
MVDESFESEPTGQPQEPRLVSGNYAELTPEQQQIHDQATRKATGFGKASAADRIGINEDMAQDLANTETPYRDMAVNIRQAELGPATTENLIRSIKEQAEVAIQEEEKRLRESVRLFGAIFKAAIELSSAPEGTIVSTKDLDKEQKQRLVEIMGVDYSKKQPHYGEGLMVAPTKLPNIILEWDTGSGTKQTYSKNTDIYQKLIQGEKVLEGNPIENQ